jgi:hypothetical protein
VVDFKDTVDFAEVAALEVTVDSAVVTGFEVMGLGVTGLEDTASSLDVTLDSVSFFHFTMDPTAPRTIAPMDIPTGIATSHIRASFPVRNPYDPVIPDS